MAFVPTLASTGLPRPESGPSYLGLLPRCSYGPPPTTCVVSKSSLPFLPPLVVPNENYWFMTHVERSLKDLCRCEEKSVIRQRHKHRARSEPGGEGRILAGNFG